MSEQSKDEPESDTQDKSKGLPKKEEYEDEMIWDGKMREYFAGRVVITHEEYEEYKKFSGYPREANLFTSDDFKIGGERYFAAVFQFIPPGMRPPHEWLTHIFVVKKE